MGDGFLLEFPSAVEAVECAVELQQRTSEQESQTKSAHHIVLRIGINVGDIMVEDGDVFGDGVNIAARLEVWRIRVASCCHGPPATKYVTK